MSFDCEAPRDMRLADLSYVPHEFLTLLSLYHAVQAPECKNSYGNVKMTLRATLHNRLRYLAGHTVKASPHVTWHLSANTFFEGIEIVTEAAPPMLFR